MKTYRSYSSKETRRFGYKLAKKISNLKSQISKPKGATVIAMQGDLGAGKTTFVQGFLSGLGVKKRSASPTFIIYRRFKLGGRRFKNAFHVDAYRIKKARELGVLGFKEIVSDPENVVLVEWAENIRKILPKDSAWFKFRHGKDKDERVIEYISKQ